jgi:hypothetical protein
MTRTVLAAAAALVAATTIFGTAAQACISCEYVPEVVNTPVRGQSVEKKRVVAKKQAPVQKRVAKAAPVAKKVAPVARKAEPVAKEVEAAKAEPVEATQNESRPISTASLLDTKGMPAGKPAEEIEVAGEIGCKKFFPTIGKAVTVPCE